MNGKIINGVLIFAVAIFLTLLAIHVRTGVTADSVAILKTTGMTCGSCSSTITTTLEGLNGVAATEVDVEGGWVVVGYNTRIVKPETLAGKIRDAGFGSSVYHVMTPEQFKRITGKDLGTNSARSKGCCGSCTGEQHH